MRLLMLPPHLPCLCLRVCLVASDIHWWRCARRRRHVARGHLQPLGQRHRQRQRNAKESTMRQGDQREDHHPCVAARAGCCAPSPPLLAARWRWLHVASTTSLHGMHEGREDRNAWIKRMQGTDKGMKCLLSPV